MQRGDEVEGRYQAYRERLQRFFEALAARLEEEAPDLRAELTPPTPVPHGYGILPKLLPDSAPRARPRGIVSASFSWSRTESFVERDSARLHALEARLGDPARLTGEARRREYDRIVDEYKKLAGNRKLIESTIQYNRLWQGEIVRHPRVYREMTSLHDAVLERQALLGALPLADERLAADLRARADELSRRIEEAIRKLPNAAFLRIDHPSPHRWVLRVPVYTDIEDSALVEQFRAAIENAWQVRDGEEQFSVALDIRRVPPVALYPGEKPPAHGAHIDLVDHTRRFPPGGAVLTTGATITHVRGRNIILGPHDVAPNTLAHEFGHILGFKDGYFRGYRDRGPDGYEVLEVILDPDDIVGAPEDGRVRRQHFEQILSERATRDASG